MVAPGSLRREADHDSARGRGRFESAPGASPSGAAGPRRTGPENTLGKVVGIEPATGDRAWQRVIDKDVRYRFVIDMTSGKET